MRPASQTAPWTGITEVRRIGLGTRIGVTFFKVFVTIKRYYPKKRNTLKSSYFGSKLGKIAIPSTCGQRQRPPSNGHIWGTEDWSGYPLWLNLLPGICDNKTYLTKKNATPSYRVILVRNCVKSQFHEHAASVTHRSLNGHNWRTADWPGYPHWLNVFQGIFDNRT